MGSFFALPREKIRALPAREGGATPAIALTAFARPEDRRGALLLGFQMHVPKPVDPPELIAVIASVSGLVRRPESSPGNPGPADNP